MPNLTPRSALLLICAGCTWVSSAEHQARLDLLDEDSDGFLPVRLGGADCDDSDPDVSPAATERCATPYDDDCDGVSNEVDAVDVTTWYRDEDGDEWGGDTSVEACEPPGEDYVELDGDCNDDDPDINPGAPELCPGLGLDDLDCDPEPRACTAPADELLSVLDAAGAGRFFVDEARIVERTPSGLYLWSDPRVGLTSRDGAERVFEDADAAGPVAVAGSWAAVGREIGGGEVAWKDLRALDAGTLESPGGPSRDFGIDVAWRRPAVLAVLNGLAGGRVGLFEIDLDSGSRPTDRELPIRADRLVAGGPPGDRQLLAATSEPGRSGTLVIVGQAQSGDRRLTGEGLGEHGLLVVDVDGDGIPDVLASTADALYVWRGPFTADRTLADAWWSLPLPRPASGLAVADLGDDGDPDLIVGLPGSTGGGEVHVYRDAGTRPDAPWAVLGPGRASFGTSVGAARVRIDGAAEQVVLVGDTSGQEIVALPWP